jgi:hypothetical protein
MTLTSRELKILLFRELGVPAAAVRCRSAEYVVPTKAWIEERFREKLSEWLNSFRIEYNKDLFNCVNYTDLTKVVACYCHSKTPDAPKAQLAVGEFEIPSLEESGHDLICWIAGVNGKPTPIHWDPQAGTWKLLEQFECIGCVGSVW